MSQNFSKRSEGVAKVGFPRCSCMLFSFSTFDDAWHVWNEDDDFSGRLGGGFLDTRWCRDMGA